jgi:hypothetical protein
MPVAIVRIALSVVSEGAPSSAVAAPVVLAPARDDATSPRASRQ